jgi:hypothetical protein
MGTVWVQSLVPKKELHRKKFLQNSNPTKHLSFSLYSKGGLKVAPL